MTKKQKRIIRSINSWRSTISDSLDSQVDQDNFLTLEAWIDDLIDTLEDKKK